MTDLTACFSSKNNSWATPWDIFNKINKEYGPCDLDVCATKENTKCERYFTEEQNGLIQPWEGICWLNPPYSEIITWVNKAAKEVYIFNNAERIICLIPARTDTKYFHQYVAPYAHVIFIKGRIKFEGAKNSAPFPSILAIYGKGYKPNISTY